MATATMTPPHMPPGVARSAVRLNRILLGTYAVVYPIVALLTGACVVLSVGYYISQVDTRRKCLAMTISALCVLMTIFEITLLAQTAIGNVDTIASLPHFNHWPANTQFILSRLIAILTQCYFVMTCSSLYPSSRRLILYTSVILMTSSMIGALFGTLGIVHLNQHGPSRDGTIFSLRDRSVFWVGIASTGILDVGLCVLTCSRLAQFRQMTHYRQTRNVLHNLLRACIETYMLTAFTCIGTATVSIMAYATTGITATKSVAGCYAMNSIMARIYALTCLYTLILRLNVRNQMDSEQTLESPFQNQIIGIQVHEDIQVSTNLDEGVEKTF